MKVYHYALFFALICFGFFVTAFITLRLRMREESNRKTEYECLVAAVDSAVDRVFSGSNDVSALDLQQAEEAFFRTLEIMWSGTAGHIGWEDFRRRVPCIVVFLDDGYYRYCRESDAGYGWSEFIPYEQGEIPLRFFEETEQLLKEYHDTEYSSASEYRVVQAEGGIWEREISPPCVFAIYAPVHSGMFQGGNGFLYAASKYQQLAYYVTEDMICHLSFCEAYRDGTVIGCYASQKESAMAGAVPCEKCLGGAY